MKWHFTILEKSDTRMKNPKVTITKQYSSKSSCIEKVLTWRHLCKSRKGVEFPVCDDTDGTDLSIFKNLGALAAGWCFCWQCFTSDYGDQLTCSNQLITRMKRKTKTGNTGINRCQITNLRKTCSRRFIWVGRSHGTDLYQFAFFG